jgi:hypothetical protein
MSRGERMKQVFIIETKKRLSAKELWGCLDDTLGINEVIGIKEIKMENNITWYETEETLKEIGFTDEDLNKWRCKK